MGRNRIRRLFPASALLLMQFVLLVVLSRPAAVAGGGTMIDDNNLYLNNHNNDEDDGDDAILYDMDADVVAAELKLFNNDDEGEGELGEVDTTEQESGLSDEYYDCETGPDLYCPNDEDDEVPMNQYFEDNNDGDDEESSVLITDVKNNENENENEQNEEHDSKTRNLSVTSATIGDFYPLDCNSNLSDQPCDTNMVSSLSGAAAGGSLVIPCGSCYLFDLEEPDVHYPNGMHIKGKLKFPVNKRVTVHTKFVIVQGELEIHSNHATISPENLAAVFDITGSTEDILFQPNDADAPNQNACDAQPNNACNLGKMPFVVAGGKIDMDAFPPQSESASSNCKTHTKILKKVIDKPSHDSSEIADYNGFPAACPLVATRTFLHYDFNDGTTSGWIGKHYSTYTNTIVTNDNGALKVSNRERHDEGPAIDILSHMPHLCLEADRKYLFSVKLKLDRDGMNGQPTYCTAGNPTNGNWWHNCPLIRHRTKATASDGSASQDAYGSYTRMVPNEAGNYGEWNDFTGTITFKEENFWTNVTEFRIYIERPEIGTDMTIDDFRIELMPESSLSDPSDVCGDMVMNWDFERNGANPYPFRKTDYYSSMKVMQEDEGGTTNHYLTLSHRLKRETSFFVYLPMRCMDLGTIYKASAKVRLHPPVGGGDDIDTAYSYKFRLHGESFSRTTMFCPPQKHSDGWVTCSGEFFVDEAMANYDGSYNINLRMEMDAADATFDIDYDDIRISYVRGVVGKLIVDKNDAQCWGVGADVHIGSSSLYSFNVRPNGSTSPVSSVVDMNDGTLEIGLETPPAMFVISVDENALTAADVALVSRNVKVAGELGEVNKGAYFQVLHTMNVQQKISGVEFDNMGRRGEYDRHGLQILYSGSLEGTDISMNTFHNSNHRCIVIEGSYNITIADNVAVQNEGHCIYNGPNAYDNTIQGNFVSETTAIPYAERLTGADDYHAAGFYQRNGPNDYVDNISVGNRYNGFNTARSNKVRLEDMTNANIRNPRSIAFGRFENNQAKSNGNNGMTFSHHEQAKWVEFSGLESLKNRYHGFYLYRGQHFKVKGSYLADNGYGITMVWCDDVEIENTDIVGITEETKAMSKGAYDQKRCHNNVHTSTFPIPIGYTMPTDIYHWDVKLSDGTYLQNKGAKMTDVRFSRFDHNDECEDAFPIKFDTNFRDGHWDYASAFQNVQFDGTKIMDATTASEKGIQDIVITDIDGFSDPSGGASTTSSFVSDRPHFTDLAGAGECTSYWQGVAYCKNICYRTLSVMVEQANTANYSMKVTRTTGNIVTVYGDHFYRYDGIYDSQLRAFEGSYRKFSVSLPKGTYQIEFFDGTEPAWPRYAFEVWEGVPECDSSSHANGLDVTIIEPTLASLQCNELLRNSDFSAGDSYWYHRNGRNETARGYISVLADAGRSSSKALGHFDRESRNSGIGQNFDTRCLHQNAGKLYEIRVWFKRVRDGTSEECDRFNDGDWLVRCPVITIKHLNYKDAVTKEETIATYPHPAKTVMPTSANAFNLVHGVFKVENNLAAAQQAYAYIEYLDTNLDFIVDDFTVTALELASCNEELVRNGDFEVGYSTFWDSYGTVKFNVVDIDGTKAIEVKEKDDDSHGIYQWIYMDRNCINVNDRYILTARFRMKDAQGSNVVCDVLANYRDNNYCSRARVESKISGDVKRNPYVAYAATIAEDQDDGWSIMAGIFTMSEHEQNHDKLHIRLVNSPTANTVFYDDVIMQPVPMTCEQMILNPTFQGTSSFWIAPYLTMKYTIVPDNSIGTSGYALLYERTDSTDYRNSHFLYQNLDTRCIAEGEEIEITMKVKILNAEDLTTVLSCDVSENYVYSDNACPLIYLYGYNCAGDNEEYEMLSESQDAWSQTEYNLLTKDFVVGENLATCKDLRLGIGRRLRSGQALLFSEVNMGLKTTSTPTKSPTFKPTERNTRVPTTQPSSKPSTDIVRGCPSIDSPHTVLDISSAILQRRTGSNLLCTLTKVTLDSSGVILKTVPLARSYDGNDWEVAAGEFASVAFPHGISCYGRGCQVNLPPPGHREEYRLSSYSYSLSQRDQYARFLESSTFGILEEELDALDGTSGAVYPSIVSWVQSQMNPALYPITSHREYWRERANPRAPAATHVGIPDHPCHQHSRWRRYSFVRNDLLRSLTHELSVTSSNAEGTGPYTLYLNGVLRTVVDDFWHDKDPSFQFDPNFKYILCRTPDPRVGGRLWIRLQDGRCVSAENPEVNVQANDVGSAAHIIDLPDNLLVTIDEDTSTGEQFILQSSLSSSICSIIPTVPDYGDKVVFGRLSDGTWLHFDPRLQLETNTFQSPLPDGGKGNQLASGGASFCSNAPRTFLNEHSCIQASNGCQITSSSNDLEVLLDSNTISELNVLTKRYVYTLNGLYVIDQVNGDKISHPCHEGRSRWVPKDSGSCNPTSLNSETNTTLHQLLSSSSDINPHLRDIFFSSDLSCDAADTRPDIEIIVNDQCWERVHQDYMSIYDMTYWASEKHPGGPDHIKKFSVNNGTVLVFPNAHPVNKHPMSRWYENSPKFTYIGRYGDYMRIRDLPNELRTEAVTTHFDPGTEGSIGFTCGSPGEVSNSPAKGLFFDVENNDFDSSLGIDRASNRQNVWFMVALGATDQLRQRVAWSLSQILVVVTDAIGSAGRYSEWFFVYYDIFIRNAFGNYRDILREISYSPIMAENLSFLQSKSSAYLWERYHTKAQADENFAREIMQLFTMGIKKLNMDGSLKLDRDGNSALAYTNEDVMSLSRAWTGFDLQASRSNIEGGRYNRLDPMNIEAQWRDRFPKTNTIGGYIGDHYPLCVDLPEGAFLRKGAMYRFLGSSPLPELMSDPTEFASDDTIQRITLTQSSALRGKLCNSNSGACNFQNTIVLDSSLPCDGTECNLDTVRVVQVGASAFYEYVRVPCVNQVFFKGGRKISQRYSGWEVMCANPDLPDASEACCSQLNTRYAERNYIYDGERMLLSTAEDRCSDIGREVCDYREVTGDRNKNYMYFWTSDDCHVQVKVNLEGMATVVHNPTDSTNLVPHVDKANENYFKVYWKSNNYPKVSSNDCGICEVAGNTCLCDIEIAKRQVFNAVPRSTDEMLERLYIGAPDPISFNPGTYTSTTHSDTGITVYLVNGQFNQHTIFEFTDDKGRHKYLKNAEEMVIVRNGDYRFRNAPQFMSFVPTETSKRDAEYETEATLDHYFYHDNTAPFLALRLIQRLTLSNPSPRYILTVATAFKEGQYRAPNGHNFGTGKYGDMAATFASIYLDRESRSIGLDADPSHGSLREPILKLVSVFRSMKFESKLPVTYLRRVKPNIGQLPHAFDSVFSFFLPEYKPFGRVGDATLVAPEATLLDMPKIVGMMNAFRSLVKFGLSSCGGGFGWHRCTEREYLSSRQGALEYGIIDPNSRFYQETFEGPSLRGGYDNQWVGRHFHAHTKYGAVVVDPLDDQNHVYHPQYDWHSRFYSAPAKRSGNTVVRFKYHSSQIEAGGCIGYDEKISDDESLNSVSWIYCDARAHYAANKIEPDLNSYIACQFEIPSTVDEFRIVVGDRINVGEAYFDDIAVTVGTGTSCDSANLYSLVPSGVDGHSTNVVDELATLLTAGRLSAEHKIVIRNAYDSAGSPNEGLKAAQQLILSSAEFHTTNTVKSSDQTRQETKFPNPSIRPYRAVVYIMLSGGADSFNILAPHTCSNGKDLYKEYLDVRQQVAITKQDLLPINANNQICEMFGIHPDLTAVRDLYVDNDLLFFANAGVLSQPVDKTNYNVLTQTQLFAHNHMQREAKRVDPYGLNSGTGVLGRMSDILSGSGYNVGSFAVDRFSVALVGQPGVTASPMIVNRDGVPAVYLEKETRHAMKDLHNASHTESGFFGDLWSAALTESLNTNDLLSAELRGITLDTTFPTSYLSRQLRTVAKIIASKTARGVDVDTFYVEMGGFDTHANVEQNLSNKLIEVNEAIKAFSDELKVMGLWNNVVGIQTSDFARTLNPNSGDGTDHAWGGNYMMFGGSVKGGQILGEYPEDLTTAGEQVLGRGRIIPTTPWDAVFKGIANWAGVQTNQLNKVCPNLINFSSLSFEDKDMIYLGEGSTCSSNSECDDNNGLTNDICESGKCKNNPLPGCGNGICESHNGESCRTCPKDCTAPFYCNKLGQFGDFDGVEASSSIRDVQMHIVANSNLVVTSIETIVNGDDPISVTVQTRSVNSSNSRRGRTLIDEDWIEVGSFESLVPQDGVISLQLESVVTIDENTSQSFRFTADEGNRFMVAQNLPEGEAAQENGDLQLIPGASNVVESGATLLSTTVNYDYADVQDVSAFPSQAPETNTVTGGTGGDPHFSTFNGKSFSYHGQCDLVLMSCPDFELGLGLDVHIRTTRMTSHHQDYSYISGVAIRIGEYVLEAADDGSLIINGGDADGKDLFEDSDGIDQEKNDKRTHTRPFAGFTMSKNLRGSKKNISVYHLSLGGSDSSPNSIQIRSNTKTGMLFVDVSLVGSLYHTYGLLGTGIPGLPSEQFGSSSSRILARDGETDLSGAWNTYGEEWQLRKDELQLFRDKDRVPQYPQGCIYETDQSRLEKDKRHPRKKKREPKHLRRRLMSGADTESHHDVSPTVSIEDATKACSKASSFDFCVGDVLATGSLELAEDPFYY